MTEQEYCDLSDLQLCRAVSNILFMMNCYENPNSTRLKSVKANIRLMIDDLEKKISSYVE